MHELQISARKAILLVEDDFLIAANNSLVLEEFGRRVKTNLRTTDLAGRIGGEEFLLILPETDMDGALLLAERLRATTGEVPFDLGTENLKVTCSLGVAQRTPDDRDGGALLARADGALYAAKRSGRDRVLSDPPGY